MIEQSLSVLVESNFGTFQVSSDGEAVTQLLLPSQLPLENGRQKRAAGCPVLEEAARQLQSFLAGDLRTFDLPLANTLGTDFQQTVWRELRDVPFGSTISYAQLAQRIGRPKAVRDVGAANGRNPIPIVVPCHRVVGFDGSLTGYAGGIELKRQLLAHETSCCQ